MTNEPSFGHGHDEGNSFFLFEILQGMKKKKQQNNIILAGKPKVNFSGFFSYQVGANKCDEKKFFLEDE